jgi:hypothetical protein
LVELATAALIRGGGRDAVTPWYLRESDAVINWQMGIRPGAHA